uniref:Glycoside hydrolase family 42 N-terminal domain-containing protein n=1 Tax=Tetradesmus obliquus TaxID=3088 RepID=A0A383VDD3_TETOB|eukprot:jgi/Sobl393_1/8463/SZX62779.1
MGRKSDHHQPAVLLLLLELLLAIPSTSAKAGVELSSSVILFYDSELATPMYGSAVPQCELLLRRAVRHGGKRIQLVPTHYWYDKRYESQDQNACLPDNWADTDLRVDYYCSKWAWDAPCKPFTKKSIASFRDAMRKCLSLAVQLYEEVLIAPHLDLVAGSSKRGKWRNMLRFDPLQKDRHGNSYWEIMLQPLLQAANDAFNSSKGKTLHFAMGGEMGGTLLNHPAQYLKIFNATRAAWKAPARLQLGVTFYHAYTPGQINHQPDPKGVKPLPDSPLGTLDGGYGPLLPYDKWPGVAQLRAVLPDFKRLLQEAQFIGVSNYARAPADVQPSHMEGSTAKLLAEFAAMGVDTQQLLSSGKQLIWNEFGLGGGIGSCNDVPGIDARIGLFPWLGITGSYEQKIDPFKQSLAAKEYLKKYYAAALQLLAAGGGGYPVHGAYMWNVASWDVQGIHTSAAVWNTSVVQADWPVRKGFAVADVAGMIQAHNTRFRH